MYIIVHDEKEIGIHFYHEIEWIKNKKIIKINNLYVEYHCKHNTILILEYKISNIIL